MNHSEKMIQALEVLLRVAPGPELTELTSAQLAAKMVLPDGDSRYWFYSLRQYKYIETDVPNGAGGMVRAMRISRAGRAFLQEWRGGTWEGHPEPETPPEPSYTIRPELDTAETRTDTLYQAHVFLGENASADDLIKLSNYILEG